MVGPPPVPRYTPPPSTSLRLGLGKAPLNLFQSYENESLEAPWYTTALPQVNKLICPPIPRGPILVEIDNRDGDLDVDLYHGEFATIEDLANAAARYVFLAPATPAAYYPLVWTVPAGMKGTKVFTPTNDFLIFSTINQANGIPAFICPLGIVDRGPSSIVLAAEGPNVAF